MNTNSPRFAKRLADMLIGLLILSFIYPCYRFVDQLYKGDEKLMEKKQLVEGYLPKDMPDNHGDAIAIDEYFEEVSRDKIELRYSPSLFLFFAGFIITIIWQRGISSLSTLWINRKGKEKIDYGLYLFAVAIWFWLISENLELIADYFNINSKEFKAVVMNISTLNTTSILLGISYFTFFHKNKKRYKLIKMYKEKITKKRLLAFTLLVIVSTWLLTYFIHEEEKELFIRVPDFILALLSFVPLTYFLIIAFLERNLSKMALPILICILILVASQTQMFMAFSSGVTRSENFLLGDAYRYSLIMIFLTFTFSGAAMEAEHQNTKLKNARSDIEIRNRKLKEASSELETQNKELKEMSSELETKNYELNLLSAEMNHSIKGNLTVLLDSLVAQLETIIDAEGKTIINAAITRVKAMKELHKTIHNQTGLSIDLGTHINELCSILDISLDYRRTIENNKDIFTNINVTKAIARKISQIITEIAINSAREADKKQLTKKFLIKVEDSDEHLIIDVEDNSGGMDMNMFKIEGTKYLIKKGAKVRFGLPYVLETIQDDLNGSICITSSESGTKFNIKLPLNKLIYKLKNQNDE